MDTRFVSSTASISALRTGQPPMLWIPPFFLVDKAAGAEADHTPPSSSRLKIGGTLVAIFGRPSLLGT